MIRRFRPVLALALLFAVSTLAVAQPTVPPAADLISAAKLGDLSRARELASGGAAVDGADWRGYTPLMWASAAGHLELVQLLIERGAKAAARAGDGTTALMLAAGNGSTGIVKLLLSRGANPAAARAGLTARQLAVSRGYTEVASVLESAEALGAELLKAANEGQAMTMRQLLAGGAPANMTNADGISPMMFAARNGDLGTLQYLLSRGGDGTARDRQGQGVFEWAERTPSTRQQVTAFLRERGLQPQPPAAGSQGAPAVTASLQSLGALLAKAAPSTGAGRTAQKRAASALAQLRSLSSAWPAQSPEDYRINLAADVTALSSAMARGHLAAPGQSPVAVAHDLEAKLEHCQKSGGKLGGSVLVRVRTVQSGQEAGKWQVFYMPRIFEVAPNAVPDLFPQLSSPTEEMIVPGRYLMWVRNPASAKVGERTVVKVGEGRKELLVDLPVPAEAK
jgi:ankyrin repeat protein